jgi:hypothetical protein
MHAVRERIAVATQRLRLADDVDDASALRQEANPSMARLRQINQRINFLLSPLHLATTLGFTRHVQLGRHPLVAVGVAAAAVPQPYVWMGAFIPGTAALLLEAMVMLLTVAMLGIGAIYPVSHEESQES